eukprot:Skav228592  [mRNA]  locus=scaffold1161:30461:37461:- [translate_table: standard]
MQTWVMPPMVLAHASNFCATSISGAAPPAMRAFFFTRLRTTHKASWMDLSVSSNSIWLDARTKTETHPPLEVCRPVKRTILPNSDPSFSSITSSAFASFSVVKVSNVAAASTPKIFEMNSISSRSMSLTTMILAFAQKSSERSVTASLRIDFCTKSTLQPVFAICLTIFASRVRSSRRSRSICA